MEWRKSRTKRFRHKLQNVAAFICQSAAAFWSCLRVTYYCIFIAWGGAWYFSAVCSSQQQTTTTWQWRDSAAVAWRCKRHFYKSSRLSMWSVACLMVIFCIYSSYDFSVKTVIYPHFMGSFKFNLQQNLHRKPPPYATTVSDLMDPRCSSDFQLLSR